MAEGHDDIVTSPSGLPSVTFGRGLVAAMLAGRDSKGIRRKRLPIFMLGADHAFQDPMGRWIATGTLAE